MLKSILSRWSPHRYQILVGALLLLLFDRILFPDMDFYARYIWPINMIILGLSSYLIFIESREQKRWIIHLLFFASVVIPLLYPYMLRFDWFINMGLFAYLIYYLVLLREILMQISNQGSKVSLGILYAAISGYLLIIVLCMMSFVLIYRYQPDSFTNVPDSFQDAAFDDLTYFSMVTVTTIGYGDIAPATVSARLASMLFGLIGQIYLVAIMGILISRYSANADD